MNLSVGMLGSRPLLVRASPMDCQAPRQKLRRNTPTHPPPTRLTPRFAALTPTHTDFSTRSPRVRACACFYDFVKHGRRHGRCPSRMYMRFSRSFVQWISRASLDVALISLPNAERIAQ